MSWKSKRAGRQFLRFAFVGLFGTILHYAILVGGVSGLGGDPVLCTVVGFIAGAVLNHHLARRHVFQTAQPALKTAPKFFLVAGVGAILNAGLLAIFVANTQLHYFSCQLMVTGVVLIWNFSANKWWSFR